MYVYFNDFTSYSRCKLNLRFMITEWFVQLNIYHKLSIVVHCMKRDLSYVLTGTTLGIILQQFHTRKNPVELDILILTNICNMFNGDCIFFVLTAGLKLTWNRRLSVSSVSSGSFRWVWQISSKPSVHSENSSSSCWSRTSRTCSHFWRTSSASAHPRGLEGREGRKDSVCTLACTVCIDK